MQRFAYSRNGNGPTDEQCSVHVKIPSIRTVDRHVRYQLHVSHTRTGKTWQVSHRYSEFRKLHDDLLTFFATAPHPCPGCTNFEKAIRVFEFPPKHMFTSNSPVVLNYRKRALWAFLALLTSHTFTNAPKCPTCKDFPFTAVRDFLVMDDSDSPAGTPLSSEREAIRQSLDVKDFTRCVPVRNLKAVNSQGLFIKQKSSSSTHEEQVPSVQSTDASSDGSAAVEEKEPSPMASLSFSSMDSASSSPAQPAASTNANAHGSRTEHWDEPQEQVKDSDSFVSFTQGEKDQVHPTLASRSPAFTTTGTTTRDSIDKEFGSLNLDFMADEAQH